MIPSTFIGWVGLLVAGYLVVGVVFYALEAYRYRDHIVTAVKKKEWGVLIFFVLILFVLSVLCWPIIMAASRIKVAITLYQDRSDTRISVKRKR